MKNKKNILVNINKEYIPHFLTMLNSLSVNNSDSEFDVYVMYSDLEDDDKSYISAKIKPNVNLIYIFVDNAIFRGAPKVKRYPYEIYYRIFAPIMLPEHIDRILYLDSDIIVRKNIDMLYNEAFGDDLFIACTQIHNFMQWLNRVRMGVNKDYFYMNTGVMVMNVKELRSLIDREKIFTFIKWNGWRMHLYDQDVLFRFFGNRIKLVDAKLYNLSDRYISFYNKRNPENKIDANWVENNNFIVHYLGRNKPWKDNYKGILAEYYHCYEVE